MMLATRGMYIGRVIRKARQSFNVTLAGSRLAGRNDRKALTEAGSSMAGDISLGAKSIGRGPQSREQEVNFENQDYKVETRKARDELLPNWMGDDIGGGLAELISEVRKITMEIPDPEAELPYVEWVCRLNEIAASILGISFRELRQGIRHEGKQYRNRGVNGPLERDLDLKVLQKLKLDRETWNRSWTFYCWRSDTVYDEVIRFSTGAALQRRLSRDLQELRISTSIAPADGVMLEKVLCAIHGYYFPDVPIEGASAGADVTA